MSWSITVDNLASYEAFPLEILERMASQHDSYPRDMDAALALAKIMGLRSATLSGGRTPNPNPTGDEVVNLSIVGFTGAGSFLSEMRSAIASGPDSESTMFKHYAAIARLRNDPHTHTFVPVLEGDTNGVKRCSRCEVRLNGNLLYFEDE